LVLSLGKGKRGENTLPARREIAFLIKKRREKKERRGSKGEGSEANTLFDS